MSRSRTALRLLSFGFYLTLIAGCSRITPTPAAPKITPPATSAPAGDERAVAVTSTPEPTPGVTATPAPAPTNTLRPPTDTPLPPTTTPSPSAEPAIATPTPVPAAATPSTGVSVVIVKNPINLRSEPSVDSEILGELIGGQRYPALARTEAGDWWQIDADGIPGWVSNDLVRVEGEGAALPIFETDTQPTALPAVQVYQTTLSIPTYPYTAFLTEATDPDHNWTYQRLDRASYEASNPQPLPWSYDAVVLENDLLRITMLPDLGGRIYQVIFKPTGNNEMYENPVIKPSPWGPPEQGGWLAAGGIEWGLPVEEHGYAWADPWGHITVPYDQARTGVTLFMPSQQEHLRAEVDVILRAGEAAFTLQPRISNPTSQPLDYQFWLDALLAPGPANRPGPNLRFILPAEQVTVHSRGDASLPEPQAAMDWPIHAGSDYSRLATWSQYLGFFERPAAHGPFAAVYDEDADEGVVRVFPPAATAGSKVFAFGYANPIDPSTYTDDGSGYVELHGGVTSTFWDQTTLAAGDTYSWQETWFPVAGIGGISYANGNGAINLRQTSDGIEVGVFPIKLTTGRLVVSAGGSPLLDEALTVGPAQPFYRILPAADLSRAGELSVTLFDAAGQPMIEYSKPL